MSWTLPVFRAGDLVEVRSREEILSTLDATGCLDGLPFMPEMFQYSGRQLRVAAVAHKTCDVAQRTYQARRLDRCVHLEGTSCDGSSHGGCQADCNLFWKDAWLKPAGTATAPRPAPAGAGLTLAELERTTRNPAWTEARQVFTCQATQLFQASRPLAWYNPLQYFRDVTTGNHSLGQALKILLFSWFRALHEHAPPGTFRLTQRLYHRAHRIAFGRQLPVFAGRIPSGQPTPTTPVTLKPGDRVRVKSMEQIEATLDRDGRNRGMYCDKESGPFCGREFTVRRVVSTFLDEATGELRHTKHPCIMLEGVACEALYSDCRLLCPRAIPIWWREVWLDRVETGQ